MMKNILKKMTSATIIVVLMSILTFPTYAALQETYDLNNSEYIEQINKFGEKFKSEQEIIQTIKNTNFVLTNVKHMYISSSTGFNPDYTYCYFECENTDINNHKIRSFKQAWVDFSNLRSDDEEFWDKHSNSELNQFLSENGFTARFTIHEEITPFDNSVITMPHYLFYSEDAKEEDVVETYVALNKEFGLTLDLYIYTIAYPNYADNEDGIHFCESTSTTAKPFPTLAGDLDLDDKQGMSDIVFLTKYTASPELYPITDATALANADINQDGTIDSLDTNILIEMTLGSFESAV